MWGISKVHFSFSHYHIFSHILWELITISSRFIITLSNDTVETFEFNFNSQLLWCWNPRDLWVTRLGNLFTQTTAITLALKHLGFQRHEYNLLYWLMQDAWILSAWRMEQHHMLLQLHPYACENDQIQTSLSSSKSCLHIWAHLKHNQWPLLPWKLSVNWSTTTGLECN